MALSETKELSEVNVNFAAGTIEVRWDTIISRDGEVIHKMPHRRAYSKDEKEDFLSEVDQAAKFIDIINW